MKCTARLTVLQMASALRLYGSPQLSSKCLILVLLLVLSPQALPETIFYQYF